jgi:hypothetical protein
MSCISLPHILHSHYCYVQKYKKLLCKIFKYKQPNQKTKYILILHTIYPVPISLQHSYHHLQTLHHEVSFTKTTLQHHPHNQLKQLITAIPVQLHKSTIHSSTTNQILILISGAAKHSCTYILGSSLQHTGMCKRLQKLFQDKEKKEEISDCIKWLNSTHRFFR